MGQDLSIVLAAKKVTDETLVNAAKLAFGTEPPQNLVLFISANGPPSVMKVLPSFTAVSVWTDAERRLDRFAEELSRTAGDCVVFTMADHACIGGWQVYKKGKAGAGKWVEGDGYTATSIQGIEAAFRVKLRLGKDERDLFAESFMNEPRGLCVFGSSRGLRPGKPVGREQVQAIMEFDLPDAELECLLLVDDG